MILLKVHSAKTNFSGPKRELKRMFEALRVKDKSAFWKAKAAINRVAGSYAWRQMTEEEREETKKRIYRESKWAKFYELRWRRFGTGLLGRVKAHLKSVGVPHKVEDLRTPMPDFKFVGSLRFKDKANLRPEQLKSLNIALRRGCGILHLATNAGKTEVAAAMIKEYQKQTGRLPNTLFLVHRKGLAKQTAERFRKRLGLEVRLLMGEH